MSRHLTLFLTLALQALVLSAVPAPSWAQTEPTAQAEEPSAPKRPSTAPT